MRITISIDEEKLAELMKHERGSSRSEALRQAVEVYLTRKRIENFKKLAGSRLTDLDWRKLEEEELRELKKRHAK